MKISLFGVYFLLLHVFGDSTEFIEGKWYLFKNDEHFNMKAAAIYCSERGGKLFEPKSENVYKEVSTLAEKHGFQDWSFWIGIHDISTEGHFVYNSDNSPVVWTNWGNGQPNGYGGGEDCTENQKPWETNGKWNDVKCDSLRPFICEKDSSPFESELSLSEENSEEWVNNKYYFYSNKGKTHQEAVNFCSKNGDNGKLLEPKNEIDYDQVLTLAEEKGLNNIWIGVMKSNNNTEYHHFYYNSDHSPVTWTKWGPGEPQDWGRNDNCVQIEIGNGGKWFDDDCSARKQFVCEKIDNTNGDDNHSDDCCIFPFAYNNITYNQCTNADHNQTWCATEVDAYGNYFGIWKNCNENCKKGDDPTDDCCVFPFTYNNITYNQCTKTDHNQTWCATEVDADGNYNGNWKNCNENCKKDLKNEYIVINKNPPEVQGPFDNLVNAKRKLKEMANENSGSSSRMIIEIINGVIQDSYDGVHFINSQEQTESNGFDKYWQDWHDITDMINIYRQKISDNSTSTTTSRSSTSSVGTTTMRTTMTLPTSTIQTSTTTSNSKSTISEFLYYKNNVWAPQKLKPPYNSKLTELLYYKNNYWSKTNFLQHSSTISKNISIPLKKIPNSAGYSLEEDITLDKKQSENVKDGFNTLNFFEGIICMITLYLIGFISYKLYQSKKFKKPFKFNQFTNSLSNHNTSIEIPKNLPNVELKSNGEVSILT